MKTSRIAACMQWLMVLIALCWGPWASAQSCFIGTSNPMMVRLNPEVLEVSASSPVGTPLNDWTVSSSNTTYVSCSTTAVYWAARVAPGSDATGMTYAEAGHTYSVFHTGVPGVGMVLRAAHAVPLNEDFQRVDGNNGSEFLGTEIFLRLIVIGPLQEGVYFHLAAAETAVEFEAQPGAFSLIVRYDVPKLLIRFAVPTCAVATPSVSVPMGKVSAGDFGNGPGAGSREVPFQLQVDCAASGTSTSVHMTLTDGTDPGNLSDKLSLTSSSTATGLAMELLKDGTQLHFAPAASSTGQASQWLAGTVGAEGGALVIPLSARYVRTGTTLTPGSASARATFTLNYE